MFADINFYHGRRERIADWLSWRVAHGALKQSHSTKWHVATTLAGFVVSIALILILFTPDLFYRLIPYNPAPIVSAEEASILGGKFDDKSLYSPINLPPKDDNLPEGNWLIIPKTGVRTQINEAPIEDHEDALRKGVWRATEYARPIDSGFPVILAAHRYGYLAWSNQYRRQNSFYNLDKLEIGDTFEIIWEQRKFTYEIYAGEEAKDISDYEADVILYTCKFLNSPVRFFRYARRVEW